MNPYVAALREYPLVLIWWSQRLSVTPDPHIERDDDLPLVESARNGDEQAFETLYRRHVDFVWSRVTRLIGPEPEREDLVQQIFLDVHKALPSFRGQARFRTFLYRLITNVSYEHLRWTRRRLRVVPVDELMGASDPQPSPEERAERRRQITLTWSLLDRLKPEKRVAFLLRVVEGLSFEEIAAVVNVRPPTVWARVHAAEKELLALRREHESRERTK